MNLPASVRAVVFDLDGVLWLSTPVHAHAFSIVLAGEELGDFDYSHYAGMTTKECLAQVFRERGREISEEALDRLAVAKSGLALEALRSDPPLTPGCRNVIEQLRSKREIALASSASPATVELFLDVSGCRDLFSAILNGRSVERSKPAGDIYRLACHRMKTQPCDTVVVEDAVAGVLAGKDAGASVWAIASTCPVDALVAAGADRVIHCLSELL